MASPPLLPQSKAMSLKDTQDLASSNALNLSNTMRIMKNDTNLRWFKPFFANLQMFSSTS
ncbi:hypothetical protein CCACVL1_17318 [Corchorus capsularis]|uniref:Uncharacterized protein n=1 Tax=Corchorus capsularis TaxID=210143 RepID=A0A1R3HSP9_COCAP|nr:hypothetical protein CCACVL1_17318 [Corchorus capsularis]